MPESEFKGSRATSYGVVMVGVMLAACQATPGAPTTSAEIPVVSAPTPPSAGHASMPRLTDIDDWVRVFDDPARDSWQHPDAVVTALAIPLGSTVAEIGSGTGYFSPWLARAVGPEGRVVAVDIEPALIAHLRERAIEENTPQVEARLGDPGDPKLRAGEVDRVLLVDTYRYIGDRVAYFGALRAAMRPEGRLVIVDFAPGESPHGPPAAERLEAAIVIDELGEAGWDLLGPPGTLPEQYVLVFRQR